MSFDAAVLVCATRPTGGWTRHLSASEPASPAAKLARTLFFDADARGSTEPCVGLARSGDHDPGEVARALQSVLGNVLRPDRPALLAFTRPGGDAVACLFTPAGIGWVPRFPSLDGLSGDSGATEGPESMRCDWMAVVATDIDGLERQTPRPRAGILRDYHTALDAAFGTFVWVHPGAIDVPAFLNKVRPLHHDLSGSPRLLVLGGRGAQVAVWTVDIVRKAGPAGSTVVRTRHHALGPLRSEVPAPPRTRRNVRPAPARAATVPVQRPSRPFVHYGLPAAVLGSVPLGVAGYALLGPAALAGVATGLWALGWAAVALDRRPVGWDLEAHSRGLVVRRYQPRGLTDVYTVPWTALAVHHEPDGHATLRWQGGSMALGIPRRGTLVLPRRPVGQAGSRPPVDTLQRQPGDHPRFLATGHAYSPPVWSLPLGRFLAGMAVLGWMALLSWAEPSNISITTATMQAIALHMCLFGALLIQQAVWTPPRNAWSAHAFPGVVYSLFMLSLVLGSPTGADQGLAAVHIAALGLGLVITAAGVQGVGAEPVSHGAARTT